MTTKASIRISTWVLIPLATTWACALGGTTPEEREGYGPDSEPYAQRTCPDTPAPELFERALCVCEDLGEVGTLRVRPGPAGDAAAAGINEFTRLVSTTDIEGDLHVHGGLNATADLEVSGNIASDEGISFAGELSAGGDLASGGDLDGVGSLFVGDTLRVAGVDRVVGERDVGAEGAFQDLGAPPCGCDSDEVFDVAAAVEEARGDSDNDELGISTSLSSVGESELVLPSGSYFFDDISSIGSVRIVADGAVALYVEGSLDAVGRQELEVTEGSTLDLYVSGRVRNVGNVTAGAENAASDFRLYVGGEDAVKVAVGKQEFYGAIYAPEAQVRYVGDTTIHGGLFARSLGSVGDLEIAYTAPGQPDECEGGDGDGDGEDEDGGDEDGGDEDGGDEDGGDDDGIIVE